MTRIQEILDAEFSKAVQPPNSPTDEPKAPLSERLQEAVAAMVVAAPSLHPQTAMRWLMHTPQGQQFLSQHTKKEKQMPQVDIMKAFSIMEDVLNAQVTRMPGETFAKSFSRKYESDIDFRKQWASLTDAKLTAALGKGMASLKPTTTETGNTLVADDSAEAVRQLTAMAEAQGRTFEQVFADPANMKLASKTYTSAHRSSPSYDAELEG
jgi:hypothetical protein